MSLNSFKILIRTPKTKKIPKKDFFSSYKFYFYRIYEDNFELNSIPHDRVLLHIRWWWCWISVSEKDTILAFYEKNVHLFRIGKFCGKLFKKRSDLFQNGTVIVGKADHLADNHYLYFSAIIWRLLLFSLVWVC